MIRNFLKQACHEPYRLFFPLGILIASVGAGHWGFYAFGLSEHSSAYFHSTVQTQGFMVCFIVGFLMTAMPRFASSHPATPREVIAMLALILGHFTAASFGQWAAAQLCFLGVLVSLLIFAKKRVGAKTSASKGVSPPLEFVWIPAAILHGITGSSLMIYHQFFPLSQPWAKAAKLLSEQGFMLCVVIGVGGFLAPRLMGTFRVYVKPGQLPGDKALTSIRKRVLIFHLAAIAAFFTSYFAGIRYLGLGYFIRAAVITAEYFWTCSFIRFPKTPEFYVRLLWLSLWMVVIGSWATWLAPQYRTAMLHILFIGGLSLMIFSVATMVVLSHGGAPEKLKKPLWILRFTAVGVPVSLGFRLAAAFLPELYFPMLGVSSLIWTVLALSWFLFALPKMGTMLTGEELERCHEEAKERVARLRQPERPKGDCCGHKGHSCA